MDFKHRALPALVLGHLIVLGLYIGAVASGQLPTQAKVFAAGFEIYCTLALGVGLLIGASPFPFFRVRGRMLYGLAAVLVAFTGTLVYDLLGLQAMGTIAVVLCGLVALEWLAYLTFKVHALFGATVVGGALAFAGYLGREYHHLIVLTVS